MPRVVVAVVFTDAAVQSVRVEQWRRQKKTQNGPNPNPPQEILNSKVSARKVGPGLWVTDAFNTSNPGANKLHLRVVGFDQVGEQGNRVAVIAVPPRKHPKR